MSEREAMIKVLKQVVQPHLRSMGFVGAFPHYRRTTEAHIDLLTFQFDRYGGGFVVEVARSPVDGVVRANGTRIAPTKVTAWDVNPQYRNRVQERPGPGTNSWFRYDTGKLMLAASSVLRRLEEDNLWSDLPIGRATRAL